MNIRQTTGLTLLLACVTPIQAQIVESDGWASIRNLRRGDRIGVISTDRKRLDGRFETATDSAIAVARAGGEQGASGDAITIPQASVIRVYKFGTSRRKRMLIGVAAGLGAGAAVAVTLSRRLNNEGFFAGPGSGAATAVAGGAGIGLAVGSLSGSGYQTVYQRPGGR
jgi:hypothetical protein